MRKKQVIALCMLAMLGLSATACGKTQEPVIQEEKTEDLTQFEGSWYSNNFDYDKVIFDKNGNLEIYSAGSVVFQGNMKYVENEDCYYIYNDQDVMECECRVLEDGSLTIESYGDFVRITKENAGSRPVTTIDFTTYYDFWYKDGNMEETYLLLDATGIWELYDAAGVITGGVFALDTETNNAIVLKDELGEKIALVHVDDTDIMTMDNYNEELMKLPSQCTFFRESASK